MITATLLLVAAAPTGTPALPTNPGSGLISHWVFGTCPENRHTITMPLITEQTGQRHDTSGCHDGLSRWISAVEAGAAARCPIDCQPGRR